MLISIKSPEQFKKVPWKNGKGETIELAINDGGTLDLFDWRISIASVVENGVFSNFTGYTRNLTLIEGQGIDLHHDTKRTDSLQNILDVAIFDGGCETLGQLHDGAITDFNVIVNTEKYQVKTSSYVNYNQVNLVKGRQYFSYCLQGDAQLASSDGSVAQQLPAGHLLHISQLTQENMSISGQMMIIVELKNS